MGLSMPAIAPLRITKLVRLAFPNLADILADY